MRPSRIILIPAFVVLAAMQSACSWVELTSEGEVVRVATEGEVSNCQRIGQTASKVLNKVAFVNRNDEKKQEELTTMARNEAATMGGDTIVPATDMEEGRQRFVVYKCR